jgi:polyhydroxyalkanoate synthase
MRGLKRVLELPFRKLPPVGTTPHVVVHEENKWKLLRYQVPGAVVKYTEPVLLVPSLINRHYVLDLLPGKSFAEWLCLQGFDVYCIDWGTPGDEDRYLSLDTIFDRYVGRAIKKTATTAGVEKIHVLGYCLGGTMAVCHTALRPEKVLTLTALATPIVFSDDGLLSKWTNVTTLKPKAIADGLGNVPWQLLHATFKMLRPTLDLSKAVHVLDRQWDDESFEGFLALETWGNDSVSFPGACFTRYIEDLYQNDALIRGTFELSGKRIHLSDVKCPTHVVTFEHDHIVPWKGARALVDEISATDKEWLHLSGSHVGAVVSKSATTKLWPKLLKFWVDRSTPVLEADATPVRPALSE